jgi:outer membrane protease
MQNKLNESDFEQQDEQTRLNVIQAYCKTVESYMATGFSYSYSCSIAAAQSYFQKNVIMRICKKELSLVKLRDDYKRMKIEQRKKFNKGVYNLDSANAFDENERINNAK